MDSEIIIIIDTEEGFSQRFKRKLDEEDISEKYQIKVIPPNTSLSSSGLIENNITQLEQFIKTDIKVAVISQ
jgi:hypothetical protein